jgi:polypeptide N-acetylgalactosaminyltransferase
MVDAPCSRVGHIFRCKYSPFADAGVGDYVSRNNKRVAEVWMDEYKEQLYKRQPSVANADAGMYTICK